MPHFIRLYMRNIRQIPRIPTVLVFGVAMPVIQLLLLGSVFSQTIDSPQHPYHDRGNYYMFITPAIILLTAVIGMANSSAAFIVDLRTGYFDKLRTTPATPAGVIVARLAAEMTRVTAQALLILGLALVLDARIETGVGGAVVMVAVAILFGFMTTGLGVMALAMKTKSDQATQSAFPLFFVLLFLSTAFMPAELLPDWLATAVQWNPVNYIILGMRALMFDSWGDAMPDLAIGIGFGVVLAAIFALIDWRVYRKMVD